MKILFVSLGCDKNSVDSEVMLGYLSEDGHTFTDDEEDAEAAVINTCCFINDAKEESINTIIELGRLRQEGKYKALIVTGCLAQRYPEEIRRELPEVDAIVGTASLSHIGDALKSVLEGAPKDFLDPTDKPLKGANKRIVTTGGYFDYLKIAEGCNKHCTYCVIPSVRGPFRSVPEEDLVKEAEELSQKGVRELILVAQETTLYGIDLYKEKRLPKLLERLCGIDGIEMIRLLYCYPEEITDELIDVMAKNDKIMNYLDIPIQSGSDRILKLMGRKTNSADIRALVGKLRDRIPDICIRTTLISGFPGENANDHEESLKLVKDMRFDRLGVFTYSCEENTPAASMKEQIPEKIKEKRRDEIMAMQQEISAANTEKLIGCTLKTIIEGSIPEDGIYVGRTYRDAPDVDGYLFINSERELMSGDIVDVFITDSDEYDLIGEIR